MVPPEEGETDARESGYPIRSVSTCGVGVSGAVNGRAWLLWTCVFTIVGGLIAYLNKDHRVEQTIFEHHHVAMAEYLSHDTERELSLIHI